MVRAAEDGKSGDPNQYLDYEIAPPVNRFVNINRQARDIAASDTRLIIDGAEGGGASSVTATRGPVVAVDGDFERFEAIDDSGKLKVQISGTQPVSIVARAPIDAMQGLQPAECASDRARGSHCYTWIPGAASAAVANRR